MAKPNKPSKPQPVKMTLADVGKIGIEPKNRFKMAIPTGDLLVNNALVAEQKQAVEENQEAAKNLACQIAAVTMDAENYPLMVEDVERLENQFIDAVTAEGTKEFSRKKTVAAYVGAFLDALSENKELGDRKFLVLLRLGTVMAGTGFGRKVGQGFRMPFVQIYDNGKTGIEYAVIKIDGYDEIEGRLKRLASLVDEERKEVAEKLRASIYDGAEDLLKVLEAGKGETAVFCPRDKTYNVAACDVRLKLEDGKLLPMLASGLSADVVDRARMLGCYLLPQELETGKVDRGEKLERSVFNATLDLLRVVRRGHNLAVTNRKQKEQREAMRVEAEALKAKATIDAVDALLYGASGTAHFRFEEWTVDPKGKAEKIRMLAYNVRFSVKGLEVVEWLGHCDELFTNVKGKVLEPGGKFSSLPQPVQAMMKRQFALAVAEDRKRQAAKPSSDDSNSDNTENEDQELQVQVSDEDDVLVVAQAAQ